MDDASTGGESRRDASFDLLAGNRDVHMHGVPQGLSGPSSCIHTVEP